MKSKIGRVAAVSAAGALLAACHGNFYGGGEVGYVGHTSRDDAAATATSSTARSTTAASDVFGVAATADKP
ncbi:MAG TPA: hypothetical protein VK801_07670 [Caulobacteraceae bacterium]|nr:hypothetical protein [Caulobacteraceae bacterium]